VRFDFLPQLSSETFLILSSTERDTINQLLAIIRVFIRKNYILSDEKPDDGQYWPKHVVFIII